MKFNSTLAARIFAMMSLTVSVSAETSSPAPPPELLGHWSFDADTNSSVGGSSGTLQGGAQIGQPGAAVGTGCYRNTAGEGFLQTDLVALRSNDPQAVSLWIKTDATTGHDDAFYGWGTGGFQAHYDVGLKGGNLHFLLERNSATFEMPNPLDDGQWHHLLITREASALNRHTIYHNGKSVGSPAAAIGGGNPNLIRIGTGFQRALLSGGAPERDFNGWLDDFAYFNANLSASDAALIHGLARHAGTDVAGIQPARLLAKVPAGGVATIDGHLWTQAVGLPGTTGDSGGSIEAGDAWIALDDEGGGIQMLPEAPPPSANLLAIDAMPSTVTVRSGERMSFPFQLRNDGSESIGWQVRVNDPSGNDYALESVLDRLIRNSPELLGSLPPQLDFDGGATGTQMDNNPFDGGNILKTNLGGPIAYSDGLVSDSPALGDDGRYFTLKIPGLFLFAGDSDGASSFEVDGRVVSDFTSESHRFELTHGGRSWKGIAVRRRSSWTPYMVNQLFLIDDTQADMDTLPNFGSRSISTRFHFPGKGRIFYACFTFAPDGDEKWTAFENLAQALLDLASEVPTGVTVAPSTGALAGGGTTTCNLEIDALGLPPGSYPLAIDAQPATGIAETVNAPFTLRIEEPAIRFSESSIDRAGLVAGPSQTAIIATESSTGSEEEWTARLQNGGDWLTLLTPTGTTPQPLNLRFTPPANTGAAGGVFRATVEIQSGASTYLLPVSYVVERSNPSRMFMDPLRGLAYVTNSSNIGGVVAVYNTSRNRLVNVVRVGLGPSDIAISPNGAEIYILSGSPIEITRIDPLTLEVTGRREVPGMPQNPANPSLARGKLAVGPNGRIYYTDSSPSPVLRMVDFESGELLATMMPNDLPAVGTTTTGVGAIMLDPHSGDLYFTRHGNISGYPRIGRIETRGDQLVFGEEWSVATGTTVNRNADIFSDLDGNRFHVGRLVYERANMNLGRLLYPSDVIDVSAYGDLVLTSPGVHDAISGLRLADLPIFSSIAAFTPNQNGVFYHAGFGRFEYWPLPESIRPSPVAIRPDPANGGAIELGQDTLRWSSLPLVDGYRIYLGGDANEVAAAGPGSELDMGLVTTNAFTMNPAPTSGTFFWRIDAVRGDAVIAGSVHSFSVAAFQVAPREIDTIAPHDALPQRVTLDAIDGDGNPVAWSASSTSSWIKFPQASGTAGEPVLVDLDPAGLERGSHAGTVRVTGAGLTLEIPVSLLLFEVDLYRLLPDPTRPVVYGLQTGQSNGLPGYIIPIDAATGKYISAIPLGNYANDFTVHPSEDRLYVMNSSEKRIQVFELETGRQLPSLELTGSFWQINSIAAGRQGRLLLDIRSTSSFPSSATHLVDTASGEFLATIANGHTPNSTAIIVSAPGGGEFYRAAADRIQRVDISTDEPVLLEAGDSTASNISFSQFPHLHVSGDGSRVVSNQTILTADLRRIASVEKNAHAITSEGGLVAGPTGVFWADTGLKAAELPITYSNHGADSTNRVAISSDDRFIVIWDNPNKKTLSIPISSLVDWPPPHPFPGQQLVESPATLSWPAIDGAIEYQVFLGTSQAAVTSAGIGSPLRIGVTQATTLELARVLDAGFRYYWRVDALTPSGPVKGAIRFFDLPFQSSGNPIVEPGPYTLYGPHFGSSISATHHGLMVAHGLSVRSFDFDWATGDHHLAQEIRNGNAFASTGQNTLMDSGAGVLVVANPDYSETANQSGIAYIHQKDDDGYWLETSRLTVSQGDSMPNFGSVVAYNANQLLVQSRDSWRASGRVFPHFQHPDWRRGPELVPTPREDNDAFGAAIAMDGTRALIGAPGTGVFSNRRGSAFIFEYDAAAREWRQRARLRPIQGADRDEAGRSLALAGNHAALGSGNYAHPFNPSKVHIFTRATSGAWQQSATLTDPEPGDQINLSNFGRALAFHEDILFVSAPYARWRGQEGGVIYPYRHNGATWIPLPPLVPPPGGREFGKVMTVHNGWLFASHSGAYATSAPDFIHAYRIAETAGRQPVFSTTPPIQVVGGRATSIEVRADALDGNEGLVFRPAVLPPGLVLHDQGAGRALITGTPTDAHGTERWLRITVANAHGNEVVQTSQVTVLAADDLPVLDEATGVLEVTEGGQLLLNPRVGGSGPFEWQWRFNGEAIPGANNASLVIDPASAANAGRYSVTVKNIVGSVTSTDTVVTVRAPDRFTDGWTSFGGDSDRRGFLAAALGRHTFQEAWQAPAQPGNGLNPAVIAAGRVFVTPRHTDHPMQARAYNLATGELLWSRQFEAARTLNPPTWHDGRLYLQRSTNTSSDIWCLDAASGEVFWSEFHDTGYTQNTVPAVDRGGVFAVGGTIRGIVGYNIDGSRRFHQTLVNQSPWMPVLASGRLFTWSGGNLIETDRETGKVITLWDRQNFSNSEELPLVRGSTAYLRNSNNLVCLDLKKRRVLWEKQIHNFRGVPAIAGDRVYALSSSTVIALSAADGSVVANYTPTGNRVLHGQPLVLTDHLIASSTQATFVFHLETGELLQTIPHGGYAAYAAGHLVIAGSDNILRAYFANAAPEFSESMPTTIQSGEMAEDVRISLGPFAGDPDPADPLTWSIVSVSRPEIFRTLEIDPQAGDLTVKYNSWESGSSDVRVSITDSAGNVTAHTLTFTVPQHPEPQLDLAAMLRLNRQTGLYEHAVTITNAGAREVAGFDLTINGLPDGVTVNNASGRDGGSWIIHHRQPLAAGASVNLVIEYYTPVRGTLLDPQVSVGLVVEPEVYPEAPDGGLAVERCVVMPDRSVMIEFTTTPGAFYEIHYSDDSTTWKLSPVRVRAAGNRVQWIDNGPPRTETPPAEEKSRFYRVREVPEP